MKDSLELLYQVARLYYELDMTQQDIADRFYISRSRVSRLLQRAREEGVVEIKVNSLFRRTKSIEEAFLARFPLLDICVVETDTLTPQDTRNKVSKVAAQHINSLLKDNMVLGLSSGRSIYEMILEMRPDVSLPNLLAVQLLGSTASKDHNIDGPDLVRRFANLYNCRFLYLMAPMMVHDVHTRSTLLQMPSIVETVHAGENADIICTSIGSRASWENFAPKDKFEIEQKGAAGRICGFYFDREGNQLDTSLHDKIIGVSNNVFQKVPLRFAIVHDAEKVEATLGALRGRYINALITDSVTAAQVLQLDKSL